MLHKFLTCSTYHVSVEISLEDALPSTLTRKVALEVQNQLISVAATPIAASYYPDWVVDSNPPESLDYSKFDVLFFGESYDAKVIFTCSNRLSAFATPNSSSGIAWDDGSQSILQRLIKSARNSGHGTKVVLSIGKLTLIK